VKIFALMTVLIRFNDHYLTVAYFFWVTLHMVTDTGWSKNVRH